MSQRRRILCIVDAHVTGSDPVSAAVCAAGGVVERCSDVYEGLSRLGQGCGGSNAFDAVVLCLDYLAVHEYEFIALAKALAKRSARGLAVLVHGGLGSTGDVGRAMALGADEWLDGSVEGFRAALVGSVNGGTTEIESNAKRQAEISASSGYRSAGSVVVCDEVIGDRVVSDDDTTIRVPWSRGLDVPVRRPPGAKIARMQTNAKRPAGIGVSGEHRTSDSVDGSGGAIGDRDDWLGMDAEPLLSEGELAALAGVGGAETDGGVSE